ncbi:MAG: bifunctional oligoribonuclease/PAP phosphatase NrnA [Desulfobulbaceae bacterium]|uniref:Bifunctional oligoribonuclease/PAP phosphatase NrnA n=1 Tax=Candidatus Desulfatifera sulfidica TaxID=2841691 RepID=A0A8J6NBY4_9BACT|nr:bifunctional oligoribonuclease/PAP phosphatase NrnA [Candidatus Desulfatifera sulfidica]
MTVLPEKIRFHLEETGCFVLMTHLHPDGDALGSLLALADVLEGMGKQVFRYLEEPVSDLYRFMPGSELVCTDLSDLADFVAAAHGDVAAVALDCGDDDRLGREKDRLLTIKPLMVIDHHRGHRKFGDFCWVDPDRSSTGEMIYEIVEELQVNLTSAAAFNLYVAIVTDTGSFRYENTTSRTMRIVAELLDLGVRPEEACGHLYDNYSLQRLRLMEQVLATLELHAGEQLATIRLTPAILDSCGASAGDAEGFINYPRSLRTVKVAVLFKENGDAGGSVSMRAKGECDVAQVAALFGGGGHRNAAGFRYEGNNHAKLRADLQAALQAFLSQDSEAE